MLAGKLDKYRIILASRSPRRQQLLRELGIDFKVIVREYDESFPDGLDGEGIARYVAHAKAMTFRNWLKDGEIVITADTIVWCNGKVLGKPSGRSDAIEMIRAISGNTHEVITGVCILSSRSEKLFTDSSKVTFDHMSDEEISYYIDNFSPYDKAGAYGIQEWIGLAACKSIEGSYFNVVGLPVQKVYRELLEFVR